MTDDFIEEGFFVQIDLSAVVDCVLSSFYEVLDILNNIVFTYGIRNKVEFSFWTFLVVTFVLDVLAFCMMGIDTYNRNHND